MRKRRSSCQNKGSMDGTNRQIGIMGGTFDPVHRAHLALAKQAYEQYKLQEIWMLPNGNPPHKRGSRQADMQYRMEMLALAIEDIPYLKLCDIEQSEEQYHYTYETLRILNKRYPHTTFYFIMGADSLFEFDHWKEPGIICKECILLAAVRDHCKREAIEKRVLELEAQYGATIYLLDTPNMEVASADIRKRCANGEPIDHIVPASVAAYIERHGLYQDSTE